MGWRGAVRLQGQGGQRVARSERKPVPSKPRREWSRKSKAKAQASTQSQAPADGQGAAGVASPPSRRLAIVTGASSGIGLELARLLAADGFELELVGRDEERLCALADDLAADGVRVIPYLVDLADPNDLAQFIEHVRGAAPDVLVNNAGFGEYGPFAQSSSAREAAMIVTNVMALTLLAKAALPAMLARGSGRILNVASTAAFAPGAFAAVYSATKAYVLSFSEAVAEETRNSGVTITTLCPGPTATRFAGRAGIGGYRVRRRAVMNAETVARAGYKALMSGRRMVVVGFTNRLLVFAARFSPRGLLTRIARRVEVDEHGPAGADHRF